MVAELFRNWGGVMVPGWDQFTAREREVFRLLLDRQTPDDVAARLGISRVSVQRHLKNALAKLQPEGWERRRSPELRRSVGPDGSVLWSRVELLEGCRKLHGELKNHGTPWSLVVLTGMEDGESESLPVGSLLSLIRASDRLAPDGASAWVVLPGTPLAGALRLLERIRVGVDAKLLYGAACVEASVHETVTQVMERGRIAARRSLFERETQRRIGGG